jgi:hypothetical protein
VNHLGFAGNYEGRFMIRRLCECFSFSVYDLGANRYTLRTDGIDLRLGDKFDVLTMRALPVGGPQFYAPLPAVVNFDHNGGLFIGLDPIAVHHTCSTIADDFCLVFHGFTGRWATLSRQPGPDHMLDLHQLLAVRELDALSKLLGTVDLPMPLLCREDVLAFAVFKYETEGAAAGWTVAHFLASGRARFLYDETLVSEVVARLCDEEKLAGSQRAANRFVWLQADYLAHARASRQNEVRDWSRRIDALGMHLDSIFDDLQPTVLAPSVCGR